MASKVKAGEAYVKISADLSELKKGADSAKKVLAELRASAQAIGKGKIGQALAVSVHAIGTAVTALGKKISSVGTRVMSFGRGVMGIGNRIMAFASLGLAGVAYATKKFIELGDTLNKMSARTGATVEWLSAMGYAAERSGANIEILEQAIRKLNKAIAEAQAGGKSQIEAFNKLKINPYGAFKNMGVAEQFELVARRLNAVQNQAEKTQIAMQLFGKSGSMLVPMLGDIDALKKKAVELGIVITKEQADTAAALLDAWTNVKYQISSIFMSLGEAIAPALKQVAEMLSKWVKPVQNFIKRHRELFILMSKGLALILIIGGALATLGAIIAGAGFAVKSIGTAIVGTGKAVKTLASLLGMTFGAIGKLGKVASFGLFGVGKAVKVLLFPLTALSTQWSALALSLSNFLPIILLSCNNLRNSIVSLTTSLSKIVKSVGSGLLGLGTNIFSLGKYLISLPRLLVSRISFLVRYVISCLYLIFANLVALPAVTWAWIGAIGAVVGVIGYIIYKTNALGKLWQWLKGVWQGTCNYFSSKWKETMDGIGDSLSVIWDAVLLGNFKEAWNLLCKDMLLVWKTWTLDIADVWDSLVSNVKNTWNSVTVTMVKALEWAWGKILQGWEYVKGKFAYGWEWIASSCKMAFNVVVKWISDTFDDITTKIQQMINRVKAWTPGTGYTSEDADFDNMILDRNNEARKEKREHELAGTMTDSEAKLRQIEKRTQERLRQLNADLEAKMKMYDESIRLLKEQDDAELVTEMTRRRREIEDLRQEIARETANLKAQNEAIKKENAIQSENTYKVWEEIEDNTAEIADNTSQKEATAEVSAGAINARWTGLGQWIDVLAHAIRQANSKAKQAQSESTTERSEIRESVAVTESDKNRMSEIGGKIDDIRNVVRGGQDSRVGFEKSMSEKMSRMLDKLSELTRNSKRYADDMEQMLTVR